MKTKQEILDSKKDSQLSLCHSFGEQDVMEAMDEYLKEYLVELKNKISSDEGIKTIINMDKDGIAFAMTNLILVYIDKEIKFLK